MTLSKAAAAERDARKAAGQNGAASRIPPGARKPQDHQAKKTVAEKRAATAARKGEADDGYLTVKQCGISLKIPIGGKVPLAAYIEFEKGNELAGTEILLGPKQWELFLSKDPTLDDFAAIGAQMEALTGN